jgi:hypothetical protein
MTLRNIKQSCLMAARCDLALNSAMAGANATPVSPHVISAPALVLQERTLWFPLRAFRKHAIGDGK